MVGGLARLRFDPAGIGKPAAHDGQVDERDADGFELIDVAADEAMQRDAGRDRALAAGKAWIGLYRAAHDEAIVRQRRVENVARRRVREHRPEPAFGFEQIERAGDALLRKQRRLHAVLGDQRIGDVLRGRYAALAHRDRCRRARCTQRNPVSELVLGQPHQPAGDGRRDHAGNADAVPHRVRIHQRFAAAVDFVGEYDGGEEIASGRTRPARRRRARPEYCRSDGRRGRRFAGARRPHSR